MTLYDNIKKRRIELNMTQQQLADLTGYGDRSSIAKIEKGLVDISQSKLELFASVLKVPPGELMIDDQDQNIGQKQIYNNPETEEIAQLISETPGLRALMKASKDLDPNDLKMFTDMVKVYKEKSGE